MHHLLYWHSHIEQANTLAEVDILNTKRYPHRNLCIHMRLHKMELRDEPYSTTVPYVDSGTGSWIFLSWQC
jgi:hypothetical protein